MITLKTYEEQDESIIIQLTEPDYYDIFKDFPRQTIKLILKDEIIAGWLHICMPKNSLGSGFIFIYIIPEHRRKGIGISVYKKVEKQFQAIGCNWWSSYPESGAADRFALSVGFDYTNTNSCLVHDGNVADASADGIRMCRIEDYPMVPDLWSREYAAMHKRIGLFYPLRELSDAERKAQFEDFCKNVHNYFVLEIDGKIVGMGGLFSDNSGIGSLAVDRAYSGNGYGTRLAIFLTNECIRRGCKMPCLYCESGNDDAMHIYKKIGYVEKKRESIAIKN